MRLLNCWLFGSFLTLIVICDVAEMVFARVMSFAYAHRVVREVHIAVVAYLDRILTEVCEDVRGFTYRNVHGVSFGVRDWGIRHLYFGILKRDATDFSPCASRLKV